VEQEPAKAGDAATDVEHHTTALPLC
jgi:hypothetical protein